MRPFIKYTFLVVVELFFLLTIVACLYNKTSWRENNFLTYLPEKQVYPNYDLETGTVGNTGEVTIWSYHDHVPAKNMVIEDFFDWFTRNMVWIQFVLFIILLPTHHFTNNGKKWLWIVLFYQLLTIPILAIACL